MKKIRKTLLRTREMMEKYFKACNDPERISIFDKNLDNLAIKKFTHWLIIENEFPYDAIATKHDMIVPKRKIAFDFSLLNKEEKEELEFLKKTYISNSYDTIHESTVSGRTVPEYFHIHLIVLKRESF